MVERYEVNYSPYRIKRSSKIIIVSWQWFDLSDYCIDSFIKDKDGNDVVFPDERGAIKWLNENVKPEYIDDDYKVQFDESIYL